MVIDPSLFTAVEIPQPTKITTEGWNATVDITLYPRKNLGVTVARGYTGVEDNQNKTYSVALEWFITRSFAVSLCYTDFDFENNRGDSDSVAVRLSGRF